jgi:hypothetical protein
MLIDPFSVRALIPPVAPTSEMEPFMVCASTATPGGNSTLIEAIPPVERCLNRLNMSSQEPPELPNESPLSEQLPRELESAQT